MATSPTPTPYPPGPAVNPEAPSVPSARSTRLSGRRLVQGRVAWGTLASLLVGLNLLLLPRCWAQLRTVCSGTGCALVQPSPTSARALHTLNVSLGGYAAVTIGLILSASLVCFVVSGVIVWRRSSDWMALLVALAQVALGTEFVPYLLQTGRSPWQLPALVMYAWDFAVLFLVFTLFPTGRFVPSWARWFVVGWVAASVAFIVSYLLTGTLLFTAYTLAWLTVFGCVGGAQVYRYRSVSRPRERAQTLWVVFAGVTALVVDTAVFTPLFLFPAARRPGSLYLLLSAPAHTVPIVLFSVCLGVAILRSRLFDIEVIIRRTLVYGLVTGTLATVYALCSIVLQAAFQAMTRQTSALAVVASTLMIAALFMPVRRRVQVAVDRRFYRRKYDAAQTVATFGQALRSEVDLARLTHHLLAVVEETMQPSQVSLWLARPAQPMLQGEPSGWQRLDPAEVEAAAARLPKPAPLPGLFAAPEDPRVDYANDQHTGVRIT